MFSGRVIHGDGFSKSIGYPTANLNIEPRSTKLKNGIYAVFVELRKKKYKAALMVQGKPKKVEAFLLGYKGGDFYRCKLMVDPVQKVSEIEPFSTKKELKKKIRGDIELVKEVLKNY